MMRRNVFTPRMTLRRNFPAPLINQKSEPVFDQPLNQFLRWSQLLPGRTIDGNYLKMLQGQQLPREADGLGIVPKPSLFGSYARAVSRMKRILARLGVLAELEGVLDLDAPVPAGHRQFIEQLERTPGDFATLPIKLFGHRENVFSASSQIPLGPYEKMALALLMPGVIKHFIKEPRAFIPLVQYN